MTCAPKRTERAFTLVEVLISLSILAIAVTILLSARMGAVRDAAVVRDERAVWALASRVMAEIVVSGPEEYPGPSGSLRDQFPEYQVQYGFTIEEVMIGEPPDEIIKEEYEVWVEVIPPGESDVGGDAEQYRIVARLPMEEGDEP